MIPIRDTLIKEMIMGKVRFTKERW